VNNFASVRGRTVGRGRSGLSHLRQEGLIVNKGIWVFRVLGILTIFVALIGIMLVALNRGVAAHGGHDLKPMLIPSAIFLVIGMGLFLQVWAYFFTINWRPQYLSC
jgi:hypothetical protein